MAEKVYYISMRDEELVTMDLELDEFQEMIANIFINEGRRREREEVIEILMSRYDESCCCDSARFGDHYLSHRQPDNFIDAINSRPIEAKIPPRRSVKWDGSGWNYRSN